MCYNSNTSHIINNNSLFIKVTYRYIHIHTRKYIILLLIIHIYTALFFEITQSDVIQHEIDNKLRLNKLCHKNIIII